MKQRQPNRSGETPNQTLHRLLGRGCYHQIEWQPSELGGSVMVCKNGCPVSLFDRSPDYTGSISDAFDAQAEVIEKVGGRYADALAKVLQLDEDTMGMYEWLEAGATAIAEQRTTAMIQALGEKR